MLPAAFLEDEAGVGDEHGEGWNAKSYDSWKRVRTVRCSGFERIQGVPCARSRRQETLSTTMMTFSVHLDLPPVHPTPTAPNSFSLFNIHKHVVQVPSPTHPNLHQFVPAPLLPPPPLPKAQGRVHNSADSKKLYFFVKVENYASSRLHLERQTTSPLLPSTIQYSIPAEQPSS